MAIRRLKSRRYALNSGQIIGYNNPISYEEVLTAIRKKHGDDFDEASISFYATSDSYYGDCDHYVMVEYTAPETMADFEARKKEAANFAKRKAELLENDRQKDLALLRALTEKYKDEL